MADETGATADEAVPDDVVAAPEPEPELMHGAIVVRDSRGLAAGDVVLHCGREHLVAVVTALRDEGYWQCIDLCAVDYLTHPGRADLPAGVEPERFEVVVSLLNHLTASRVRIRVQVPADDAVVPTLFRVHPGAEAMEREAFDMYGIAFDGNPDLSRILMPDEWTGHPLRKDYAIGHIPVQFKEPVNAPDDMGTGATR